MPWQHCNFTCEIINFACDHPLIIFFLVCKARIDLGFLVDGTNTVLRSGSSIYQQVIEFLREFVRQFAISRTAARIGIVTYASQSKTLIGFSRLYTRGQVYTAIRQIRELGGKRRLGKALTYAKTSLYRGKPQCGRRRILICLTGGASIDQVQKPAVALMEAGVEIFMIGVGRVDSSTLLQVATDRRHLFVIGFTQLYTIVKTIKDSICHSPGKFSWYETFLTCRVGVAL